MRPILIGLLVSMMATGAPQAQPPTRAGAPQNPPPAANEPVKFSAMAQLVEEMVSVKDKEGKVIEGLTAKDFVVTEDGKPQTISFCQFMKLEEEVEPDPVPAAAAVKPTAPELKTGPVQSVTKNQIAAEKPGDIRYKNRRLLVLYFDMSAMPIPDQLRALAAARKFILTQMQRVDLMAMMEYSSGSVKVLQDFTDDKDALNQQIETLVIGEDQGFNGDANDAASADTGAAFGQDDSEFNIFNTDRQLAALQTAVNTLGSLNEKKSLIYFASGLTLQGVDNQAQMRSATNAAARANVSLYPIDARGLVAQAPLGDASMASPGGLGMYSGRGALAMQTRFQRSQDTMYSLAADTGGKALFDVNDLSLGIVNAQKANSSYYIIGYYTTNANLDGKFRRINISLKELTVNLDYRKGYFAGKVFGKFTTADKERQLEDALMMGDPITDLTIQMEVNYFQLNRAEYYVPVVMKIPGRELALARRGGAERTVIDFIGEIKDDYGATVQNIRDKVDIKLSGATAAQWAKVPIEYDTGYTLLPGTYSIKVLARDDETGRIGTYMNKFVVPNLNKEEKRIPISSVVLSGQRVDLKDALYTAGKDKVQAANPLVQEGQKLIPSVTRVFSKAKDMYVYLQAYERTATSTQPLVAFVTFYRGQTKAFETPPLPVTEGLDVKSKAVPLRFAIALDKLQAGQYDCQVSVVDPTGQKAAFWQVPVMLVP
ncbi:MAG: VWA domain-containing protein [Acidobacteriia bacterium]|nr:VWA domain-containing protein [Terriglobia bacterium]